MNRPFDGKVAVVTGAASGIGEAIATLFAQQGARTVVADRNEEQGEAVAEAIRCAGYEALFHKVDITQGDQVRHLIATTVDRYGQLDCAVNNAGAVIAVAELAETEESDFDAIMAVNVKGPWMCMKHEIDHMLENGGGSIVNIASGAGLISMPKLAAYCTSKAAIIHATRVAGVTYANRGIRINAVCPGTVITPGIYTLGIPDPETFFVQGIPMKRLGTGHEIAAAASWLSSSEARYVTGAILPVDGGTVA